MLSKCHYVESKTSTEVKSKMTLCYDTRRVRTESKLPVYALVCNDAKILTGAAVCNGVDLPLLKNAEWR